MPNQSRHKHVLHIHAFRFCAEGTKHGSVKHILLVNHRRASKPTCDGLEDQPVALVGPEARAAPGHGSRSPCVTASSLNPARASARRRVRQGQQLLERGRRARQARALLGRDARQRARGLLLRLRRLLCLQRLRHEHIV